MLVSVLRLQSLLDTNDIRRTRGAVTPLMHSMLCLVGRCQATVSSLTSNRARFLQHQAICLLLHIDDATELADSVPSMEQKQTNGINVLHIIKTVLVDLLYRQ